MGILRKFFGAVLFFCAATMGIGSIALIAGTEESPDPDWWGAAAFFVIGLLLLGFGDKFWPIGVNDTTSEKKSKNTVSDVAPETSSVTSVSSKPRREEMTGREIRELYDLAQRILMDMKVTHREAEDLLDWFEDHPAGQSDYRSNILYSRLVSALDDGHFDKYEADDICYWLGDYCDDVDDEVEEFGIHENHVDVGVDGLIAGGKYLMIYTDAQGTRSERTIKFTRQTFSKGNAYIQAVCLTKNANRTFRVDRIESLFSIDTGEIHL